MSQIFSTGTLTTDKQILECLQSKPLSQKIPGLCLCFYRVTIHLKHTNRLYHSDPILSMYIRYTLYIPAILTVLVLLWFFTRSSLNVKRISGIFVNITRSSNEWMFQKFFTQGCGKTIKSTQVCTFNYAICMDVNN